MKKPTNMFLAVFSLSFIIVIITTSPIQASKIAADFDIKMEKEIFPYPPRLGEEIEIVFTVTSPYDSDNIHFNIFPFQNIQLISLKPIGFNAVEETDKRYFKGAVKKSLKFSIKSHERKKFSLRARINNELPEIKNTIPKVDITVGVRAVTKEQKIGIGSYTIQFFLVDEEKGILGSQKDIIKKQPVEYRYDAVDGIFYAPGELDVPVNVKWNREIIKMVKEIEPALSDSEALLLHSDHYKIGTPKDAKNWNEDKKCFVTDEKKIFEYYLNDGWFNALQTGTREDWIKKEHEKIKLQYSAKEKEESSKAKFFRPWDNYFNSDFSVAADSIPKQFYGWWRFKNHSYSKIHGLLGSATKEPIESGKARLMLYYEVGINYYRILTDYCTTDNDGYFSITKNIPDNADNCKAYPVIYPSGPNPAIPMVNLSDPNITQASYFKDSDDSTLFIMGELGQATWHRFYANSLSVNLDTIWTDTFPEVKVPQSGCINIYETTLHARTFTSPPPSNPLRILWEPGFIPIHADTDTCWTCYIFDKDSLFISGCTLSAKRDTDEWDDDILYHEFGHYQMDFFNNGLDPWLSSNKNDAHKWWLNDTSYKATAWFEGWPNFFSGRARVGSGSDSLYINTDKLIGDSLGQKYYYFNLENPWDYSWSDSFQCGEYCEGAVTGMLFDIYDNHNEYPYPNDSARSDSLSTGFDPVFNLMADYDPSGSAWTNIAMIHQFYEGWVKWNYGDLSKLYQNFCLVSATLGKIGLNCSRHI